MSDFYKCNPGLKYVQHSERCIIFLEIWSWIPASTDTVQDTAKLKLSKKLLCVSRKGIWTKSETAACSSSAKWLFCNFWTIMSEASAEKLIFSAKCALHSDSWESFQVSRTATTPWTPPARSSYGLCPVGFGELLLTKYFISSIQTYWKYCT